MERGKSVTRPVKLNILKQQGVDYFEKDKYFYCRHCEDPIHSQDTYYAQRHVR